MNIMEKVDITKPYFFVSYACVDEVQVYTDIRRLQNHGINIWIDTELKGYVGKSWKNIVKNAIRNGNCKAVLLFVSKFALISSAVIYELDLTVSSDVKGTHFGKKVPIIPIEVVAIDDITEYCYQIANEYSRSKIEADMVDEADYKPSTNVNHIREKFFENNDILWGRIYDMRDIEPFIEAMRKYGVEPCANSTNVVVNKLDSENALKKAKHFYNNGSMKDAYDCFILSAIGGNAEAYLGLGILCNKRNSENKTRDYLQAESCLLRAVELGCLDAMYYLVGLYYNRRGDDYENMVRKQIDEIKNIEKQGKRTCNVEARKIYTKACQELNITE